ncbi:MAG: hypothetical protein ABF264_09190 [Flavobacteriales bacterium]|jgi:hypothetical protein
MPKLEISIDIQNPDEVIANEKGALMGFASKLLSKEKRKEKVENEIYLALQQELGESLAKQLKERGIESEVRVEIKD